jgi:ABC-type lipoprotein release transport system permease subunit
LGAASLAASSLALRALVGHGMLVVTLGVAVGVVAAPGATRIVSSLLFGVGARDVATYAGVTVLLLGTALVACVLPARRAVALPPASLLRE